MTKPLTVEIADDMADALAKAASDLGETEQQFARQALAHRLKAFEDNPFFARRRKGIDRKAARDWLLNRTGGEPPGPEDEVPEGYTRPR